MLLGNKLVTLLNKFYNCDSSYLVFTTVIVMMVGKMLICF